MLWKKYWIWKTKFGKTMISSSFQDCCVAVGKFSTSLCLCLFTEL